MEDTQVQNPVVKDTQKGVDPLATLVPYLPISKAPFIMETLIPKNMASEVQKALSALSRKVGGLDRYVRNALKYTSDEALWNAFSAEQIDALALYLRQFENGQGIIIADQTGIGKGRQAAGVIRHALMHGYLPVFFTKKPDLFTDMYRDLSAIDMASINPFIINTGSAAKIKDASGKVVFSPLSANAQKELLSTAREIPTDSPEAISWYRSLGKEMPDPDEKPVTQVFEIIDTLPDGYDSIFCTYSQLQAAAPYKSLWLERLFKNNQNSNHKGVVLILDESHTAGNYNALIGKAIQNLLPLAKACCYLSATFAKYPEVMPLYAKKTAIAESGLDPQKFVSAMTKGGLALQEIVASNLAESGQLIRRQRSSEGIRVAYEVLDSEPLRSTHRKRVDRIISLMRRITAFEADYVSPVLSGIHLEAKAQGDLMKERPKGLGVKQAPYFSRVFNIIDQMLFALKVEAVAQKTLELLAQDKKVVIAFKSTMGAFLSELQLSSGDEVLAADLDFIRALQKGLESVFYYAYTAIDGAKSRQRIPLTDISLQGQAEYHAITKSIVEERSELTISPIDSLIHLITQKSKPKHLGGHSKANYTVAEVTGRNQRLLFDDDGDAVVTSFRSDTEKAFRLFNQGDYDVLLINQSGSTGSSAHASKGFKDQRQRAMIIHQFELDINIEVQKRGRINRTGQVVLPEYYYITSAIPMEKRLMTMLKGKLKSLDANTTGSQKTNDDTLKSADFFNKYGDTVAWEWASENENLLPIMGYPTYQKKSDPKTGETQYVRNESKQGAIRQLTGRAGLLKVKQQERLYDELLERYTNQIALEKQQGTYDLETEFLPLDAEVKKRFLHKEGKGGNTPFGKDTLREQTIVNNLHRPYTLAEVQARITKALEGKTPEQAQQQLIEAVKLGYATLIENRKTAKQKPITSLQAKWEAIDDQSPGDDLEKRKVKKRKLQERIQGKQQELDKYIKRLEQTRNTIIRYLGYWHIGQAVKVPYHGMIKASAWGVFLGTTIGKAKNPYTLSNIRLHFGIADYRKQLTYSLKPLEALFIGSIHEESKGITTEQQKEVFSLWNERVKKASAKRESRFILTQNIVGVSDTIGSENRLIKYNTQKGAIKTGILLSRALAKDGFQTLVSISKALDHIREMAVKESFSDHQYTVRIERSDTRFFTLFIKKSTLYTAIIDAELRGLMAAQPGALEEELPNFIQQGAEMRATFGITNLEAVLLRLDHFDVQYLQDAKEVTEVDQDQADIVAAPSLTKVATSYTYILTKAFGKDSNPNKGFIDYLESDANYPLGRVIYDRPLTAKEKIDYKLIPLFENAIASYLIWKKATANTVVQTNFKTLLTRDQEKPLYHFWKALGDFMIRYPHQKGSPSQVFGNYSALQLGQAAYSQEVVPTTPLHHTLSQLQLYMQLLKTA